MREWLYPIDPRTADRDGVPPTPDRYLRLAEAGRTSFWGLRAKRHIEPGDRLWVYFKLPLGQVCAMAEVEREPYEIDNDPDGFRWEFPAVLNLDATRALNRDPVLLSALSNRRPQGVGGVSDTDLVTFLGHAGMRRTG
ncbi:hypothetical protein ACGFZQ_02455 [Streptomyces sp. NPDC048254]|uniref:hypothetical protein n=1 Tax=Streptomyces sp. NPDC048254 TaxID=3365525 RepID=UPI003715405F